MKLIQILLCKDCRLQTALGLYMTEKWCEAAEGACQLVPINIVCNGQDVKNVALIVVLGTGTSGIKYSAFVL